jgi:hypothetical protein
MMTVLFTCKNCGSGIHVYPNIESKKICCEVCQTEQEVNFNQDHVNSILKDCPSCNRKDFYSQKDFNRKIGVILFVITAIISTVLFAKGFGPQWYLSTFIILYAVDFFLFRKLKMIAICYKCETIFRDVSNISEIFGFDHEMHDRIVYKDHDFQGKNQPHH